MRYNNTNKYRPKIEKVEDTEEEKKQILVTFGANCFLKAKPELSQAHRVRTVMQAYFFIKEEKKPQEVKLKSEMYNHDNEQLTKREIEENSNAIMWGFVLGFILFLILFIFIIVFVK